MRPWPSMRPANACSASVRWGTAWFAGRRSPARKSVPSTSCLSSSGRTAKQVLSVGRDNLTLWDSESGKEIRAFQGAFRGSPWP